MRCEAEIKQIVTSAIIGTIVVSVSLLSGCTEEKSRVEEVSGVYVYTDPSGYEETLTLRKNGSAESSHYASFVYPYTKWKVEGDKVILYSRSPRYSNDPDLPEEHALDIVGDNLVEPTVSGLVWIKQ